EVSPAGLPDVADVVEKLLPAVVEISVQSKNPNAGDGASPLDENPFKNFFDDFLKRKQGDNSKPTPDKDAPDKDVPDPNSHDVVNSMGSGFIIDPKGLIVTNNHVIADEINIQVHMQDGTVMKAELVGHDPKTDIAVIRVKPDKDLPFVQFGDSDKTRIGQWVIAIGNPFGLGGSVSLGIISAKARDINSGPYDNYLQTDAAINKGNSGGPLFDLSGHVIGVNTAIFSPTGGSVGIGFSVPAEEAKSVADQLIKFGETRRGWLGVKLQSLTPDVAEGLGLDKDKLTGALVADVTVGGPSDKNGLKAGDVITGFDGRDIDGGRTLRRVVAETEVGKEVEIKIIRDKKEQVVNVTLGRLEDGEKQMAAADTKKPAENSAPVVVAPVLGMGLAALSDELRNKYKLDAKIKGVLVTDVAADSVASDKAIMPGDVVQEAGGTKVSTPTDVADAVAQAVKDGKGSILMLVARGNSAEGTRFLALKLKP
ncbi:MAG: Do family serine endopeptidase, partial [Aestuariivirga sp.]